MLDEYWPSVFDAGPALSQHWVNASCLQAACQQGITLKDNVIIMAIFQSVGPELNQHISAVSVFPDTNLRHVIGRDGHLDQ